MITFKMKRGLGRGLSSLIGDIDTTDSKNKLSISSIVRNKFQPRKVFDKESLDELTNSIRERGMIQPIVVRKSQDKHDKFELVAGERRWLAAQNAGLHEVPVVILDIDDEKSLEFAIVENVQRQDLNSVEEARGYQKLVDDFNYNHEKLSKFIGKSRSYIANSLRLLALPKDVLSMVIEGNLTAGHARALIGLNNATDIAKKIVKKGFSVRQSEVLARQFKDKKFKIVSKKDSNILNLQKVLEEKTGLNISINNKKNNTGTISFEYKDLDQLEKLIDSIKRSY